MAKKPKAPKPQKRKPLRRRKQQRSQAISDNNADLLHGSMRSVFLARILKRLGD